MSNMMDELNKQNTRLQENGKMVGQLTGFYENRQPELFNAALINYIAHCERLAINARNFPALYGSRDAKDILEAALNDAHEITIDVTSEGWVHIQMPSLIPGKPTSYKKRFLYSPLLHAMKRFLEDGERPHFMESVIAIRHVYDRHKSLGLVRDQDNVDVKTVVDAIKVTMLPDDNGLCCSHFYDAKLGEKNMTDIYVLPRSDFSDWWEKHC